MKRSFRIVANALLLVLSPVLFLALIEGFSCSYSALRSSSAPDHTELRLSQPPPYANSPYYSQELIREQGRVGATFYSPADSRLVLLRDFQGAFINHRGGVRLTTDQPLRANKRILLFGGSTIYNGEVADPFTIASYMQRAVNSEFKTSYEVINYGVTSVNVEQQFEYLKTVELRDSDIVVFYDGANDIFQGVYNNNPQGTIIGENIAAVRSLNFLQRAILQSLKLPSLSRSCTINEFLLPFSNSRLPDHLRSFESAVHTAQEMAMRYNNTLEKVNAFLANRKVRFLHFLQPTFFSAPTRTEFEHKLSQNPNIMLPGLQLAMTTGQAAIQKANPALSVAGVASYDLSDIFKVVPASEDIFLDWVHVTELGNRIVADRILQRLFPGTSIDNEPNVSSEIARFRQEDRAIWRAVSLLVKR